MPNRFAAAVGVILTGYVAVLTLRSALWESPHPFHWLLPGEHLLPSWAVLTANLAIYAWILWLCVVLPKTLQGKERVLVGGWIPGLLLSPIQGVVSVSLANAIQYLKAFGITVAFLVALAILIEGPTGHTESDEAVSQ